VQPRDRKVSQTVALGLRHFGLKEALMNWALPRKKPQVSQVSQVSQPSTLLNVVLTIPRDQFLLLRTAAATPATVATVATIRAEAAAAQRLLARKSVANPMRQFATLRCPHSDEVASILVMMLLMMTMMLSEG